MNGGAKRWMIASVTLCLLAVALVACDSTPVAGSSNGNAVPGFKTPNPGLFTPTPTFPPFTVGAWPSNYSPQKNDTVTIYVLCRVQDATMNNPSTQPSGSLHVDVNVPDLSKQASGSTDADGLAAIPITYVGAATGKPVRVYVSVNYKSKVYTAETLFTPDVTHPPTPTAAPSPSATATP